MTEHPYEKTLFEGMYRQVRGAAQDLKPDTLNVLMERVFGAIDHTVAALKQQDPPAEPIACKAGGNYCCFVQVQALPPEVLYLADHLRQSRSPEELRDLVVRITESKERVQGLTSEKHARLELPYPLLEHGQCSVYGARPVSCRAVNSSDAESCKSAIGPDAVQTTVPTYTHQTTVCRQVTKAMLAGFVETGFTATPLELVTALHAALTHDDPFDAWIKGEPIFADAEAVSTTTA